MAEAAPPSFREGYCSTGYDGIVSDIGKPLPGVSFKECIPVFIASRKISHR